MDTAAILFDLLIAVVILNMAMLAVGIMILAKASRAANLYKEVLDAQGDIDGDIKNLVTQKAEEEIKGLFLSWRVQAENTTFADFKTFEKAYNQHLAGFADFLKEKVAQVGDSAERVIAENIALSKQEVDKYRVAKMAQIDEEVSQIVREISAEVLNRAISIDDHEELVMKALEKAKAAGIFGSRPLEMPKTFVAVPKKIAVKPEKIAKSVNR